jgi:hypothetical protein
MNTLSLEKELQEANLQVEHTEKLICINDQLLEKITKESEGKETIDALYQQKEALFLKSENYSHKEALAQYKNRVAFLYNRQETIVKESQEKENWESLFKELGRRCKRNPNNRDLATQLKTFKAEYDKGMDKLGDKMWFALYATLQDTLSK